jgi:hypothetical protein
MSWEQQMRANAPTWLALDLRMMFQGHLERGFASEGVIAQDAIIRVALNPMEESVPIRLGHLQ